MILLAWLALSIQPRTEPLGTAINYLGRLSSAGEPAKGDFDFRFTLYTSAGGGTIVAGPLSVSGLGVTNGVFAVSLDFGPTAFDGQARYLELAVRPAGSLEDLTVLSPRQPLSPTPYALVASTVPNHAITQAKLAPGAVGANQISAGAISGDKLTSGTVGAEHLRPGTAAANLQAEGQSGVASGGLVLSAFDPNVPLENAGYVRVGSTHLGDAWRSLASSQQAPTARSGHSAVWTGAEMLVWGGHDGNSELNTGGRYDPATDTWKPISRRGAPASRRFHTAVWTGQEMIIWGGDSSLTTGGLSDGARYNPTSDTWTPMAKPPWPGFSGRSHHLAIWAGGEMVIWGGMSPLLALGDGARYDPELDSWQPISTLDAPSARRDSQAIWTGEELLLWGGFDYFGMPQADGFRYHRATDTWIPMSHTGAPAQAALPAMVWTGSELLLWGAEPNPSLPGEGVRYQPMTDQWTPMGAAGAPSARAARFAAWKGGELWVWGGSEGGQPKVGGRYDPKTDQWTPLPSTENTTTLTGSTTVWTGDQMIVWGGGASGGLSGNGTAFLLPGSVRWAELPEARRPAGREFHTAVWTGEEMIIWGGRSLIWSGPSYEYKNWADGGRYNVTSNLWEAIWKDNLSPAGRYDHVAVWTGTEMIIWGGQGDTASLGDGARYHPALHAWTQISTNDAPSPRGQTIAVWTGSEMIVWGGNGDTGLVNNGARYHPATDRWTPLPPTDLSPRRAHCAVWTGRYLLVWGGVGSGGDLNDGRRYDLASNTWSPISSANAPSRRGFANAVWTGTEMIIWGGFDEASGAMLNSGGRYDPIEDRWIPTSLVEAPSPRWYSTAVWNGRAMWVWGGSIDPLSQVGLNDGKSYDPLTDSWTLLPESPLRGRTTHTAVWTGQEMLVWGGRIGNDRADDGARYPVLKSSSQDISSGSTRTDHTALWTGTSAGLRQEMLIWGGRDAARSLGDGLRYHAETDSWLPLAVTEAPAPRHGHSAVWTGDKMIVWGGQNEGANPYRGDGAIFDPAKNTWQPIAQHGAPSPRVDHSAIWTGDDMIVWGGSNAGGSLGDGAIYNPRANLWTPLPHLGAPAPRRRHIAVWTGRQMIIWGGNESQGARYDTWENEWFPMAIPGPGGVGAGEYQSAVWTGSELIIFGGLDGSTPTNQGWRYNPSENTWTPMGTLDSPTARFRHSALWTGSEMIIWGGRRSVTGVASWSDGASYNPSRDSWTPLRASGSPDSRFDHTAVWTGNEMLIYGGQDLLPREGARAYLPGRIVTLYQRP